MMKIFLCNMGIVQIWCGFLKNSLPGCHIEGTFLCPWFEGSVSKGEVMGEEVGYLFHVFFAYLSLICVLVGISGRELCFHNLGC